nr:MAG TPA: tail tube protein [Caudoviricetes sp.]
MGGSVEYDKYNYIYKVGDTDYLAQMREALGLA